MKVAGFLLVYQDNTLFINILPTYRLEANRCKFLIHDDC